MKAVILAAGRGTRMRHLTDDRPKPMLDIGKERILENIVRSIQNAGITEFVAVTGYHANIIEHFFGDGKDFGLSMTYVRQEKLDGTAGAVRVAEKAIGGEPFLLTFGDIITNPINYTRILEAWGESKADGLVGVNEIDDPYKGAAVFFDEQTRRISQIVEKPPKGTSTSTWNNSGLFVFDPHILDCIQRIELSPRGEYELPDAIRLMIQDGKNVTAQPLQGFWGDIGTPEDVERLQTLIERDEDILTDATQNRTLNQT